MFQIKCWCGEVGSVDNELNTRERLLIFMEKIYIKNTWSLTKDILVEISIGKNQSRDFLRLSWLVSTRMQPYIAVSGHRYRLKVLAHVRCFTGPSLRTILIPAQLKGDTLALLICFPSALSCLQKKRLIRVPDRSFSEETAAECGISCVKLLLARPLTFGCCWIQMSDQREYFCRYFMSSPVLISL